MPFSLIQAYLRDPDAEYKTQGSAFVKAVFDKDEKSLKDLVMSGNIEMIKYINLSAYERLIKHGVETSPHSHQYNLSKFLLVHLLQKKVSLEESSCSV
jgi:hypothetical protein